MTFAPWDPKFLEDKVRTIYYVFTYLIYFKPPSALLCAKPILPIKYNIELIIFMEISYSNFLHYNKKCRSNF